jgi:hypothetical protein
VRAHVLGALGDDPPPDLAVDVDDRLQLDWATEALVLRIAQEAIAALRRRRLLRQLRLTVTPGTAGLHLRIAAEGPGRGPAVDGLEGLRAFVDLGNGDVAVDESSPGRTELVVDLRQLGARPAAAPCLRVVPS